MKKLAASALAIALLAMCTTALAGPYQPPKQFDDLSWWGQSGATPAPVKDAKVNAYWWWPREPQSNANDEELWGNRGKVLHNVLAPEVVTPPTPTAPVEQPREAVQIPLFNNVLFDYNKSFLRPEGQQATDQVVQFLKEHPEATAQVVGHASAEGTEEYNVALGQRRADAVRDYMVQQGIAPERITTASRGEAEPAVPNDTEPNRKLNRRAVFNVTLPQ